jgi:hypothetical protein
MPVPDAITAERNRTFSLPEKLPVISRAPFTRLRHSVDVDSLAGSVNLDIASDSLPLKTTHTGRVVCDIGTARFTTPSCSLIFKMFPLASCEWIVSGNSTAPSRGGVTGFASSSSCQPAA